MLRKFLLRLNLSPTAVEWIESIVIAFVLAMFIRTFFIQAFKIPSGSMIPTLLVGDRLMVNKLRYGPKVPFTHKRLPGIGKIERGDILVFIFPEDKKRDFIKRVVGLPGDIVEIKNERIWINGQELAEPRIHSITYFNYGPYGQEHSPIKVPDGNLFVLGDNSASSHDSRFWGFVPLDNVIGRAEFLYWPLNRMRVLK